MASKYVWIQYYAGPPVSKNVKSTELNYYTGSNNRARPTQRQVDDLQGDLEARVMAAYAKAGVAYPGDAAVLAGREVKTRSAR